MSGTFLRIPSHARRRAARRTLCAAAMGLAALAALAPPASAGFLDFLFEPPSPPAPLVQPYAEQAPVPEPRIVRPPVQHRTAAAHADARKTASVPCCISGEDPVAYLMHDATLRPGDAVMTRDGIRIFEGPVSSRHVPGDFVPLAAAGHVEPKNRAELAQVDVREGEALPAQAFVQQPSKPKSVAQLSKNMRRLASADR